MAEPDPSFVMDGLPPIFEKKMREHSQAKAIFDATKAFEDDLAATRRAARQIVLADRHAGVRNPTSKKARAAARRSASR